MTKTTQHQDRIMEKIAEELDLSPTKYKDAEAHYNAVGNWLNAEDSPLAKYHPQIYPQGSFAFGTAIRPIDKEEYDVDAVCQLKLSKNETTQERLKHAIGDRLKANAMYKTMLEPEGCRCWTLKYADGSQFHLDILPAIPDDVQWLLLSGLDEKIVRQSISITHQEKGRYSFYWPRSNPKGFLAWFKWRMYEFQRKAGKTTFRALGDVEPVPDYEERTPLQRIVQLMKRHRDIKYNGDDDKPASIIITTLAGRAYNGEPGILDALISMVPKMRNSIERRADGYWIPNPVNPLENFADRWRGKPRRAELFLQWLKDVEQLHHDLLTDNDPELIQKRLEAAYGKREVSAAMARAGIQPRVSDLGVLPHHNPLAGNVFFRPPAAISQSHAISRFNVPHCEKPRWPLRVRYSVNVHGQIKYQGDSRLFGNDGSALPKGGSLIFHAQTDVPEPFQVYWQVVNTGDEARRSNGLRGNIFPSSIWGIGGLRQNEGTAYAGMHWIECFIVKDNECVARSGEFVVNIA